MKADLAIYTHVLGVPGQYESVALMLGHKMDFNCCANRDSFHKSSHILYCKADHLVSDLYFAKTLFSWTSLFGAKYLPESSAQQQKLVLCGQIIFYTEHLNTGACIASNDAL